MISSKPIPRHWQFKRVIQTLFLYNMGYARTRCVEHIREAPIDKTLAAKSLPARENSPSTNWILISNNITTSSSYFCKQTLLEAPIKKHIAWETLVEHFKILRNVQGLHSTLWYFTDVKGPKRERKAHTLSIWRCISE